MKIQITGSLLNLGALRDDALAKRYTHASDGASVKPIAKLTKDNLGEWVCGVKLKGLPFEERPLAKDEDPSVAPLVVKATKPAKKVKSKKVKAKKEKPKPTRVDVATKSIANAGGSGFVSLIDKLLCDVNEDVGKIDGFTRSNYTVDEALKAILAKFPDKRPESVKKIIKVRPRHLERRKDGVFDDTKVRAPRWAVVGPGKNGSMTEIDLLHAKGKSAQEIVNFLVVTHGRDPEKAASVVKDRVKLLKDRETLMARQRKAIDGK